MNKSRRQRKRNSKRKGLAPQDVVKTTYTLKNSLFEGLISTASIALGLFLMSDFIVRLLQGQKIFCRSNESPCIGEEFFYGLAFFAAGIFFIVQVYYMLKSDKNT